MWLYIGIGVAAVLVICGLVYNYLRSKKINAEGIEVDAVISRIKENESTDANGNREVNYEYYVRYVNESGQSVEAKLGNPPRLAREGMQLRVKYLREKPKYALAVKQ